MSRTITGLFGSRAEAEAARLRLASSVSVESTRLLAKETAAAVDGLKLGPKVTKRYRDALQHGDHLLVAQVGKNERPARIIDLLQQTGEPAPEVESQQSYQVGPAVEDDAGADDVRVVDDTPNDDLPSETPPSASAGAGTEEPPSEPLASERPAARAAVSPPPNSTASPDHSEDFRGTPAGSARLRSTTREMPAEEQVSLTAQRVDVAHQTAGRRVTVEEAEAAGLLKERTLEFVEMREEPIVSKEIVVREEVIVRKTINERTETIRDTVRRTDVEVEELH